MVDSIWAGGEQSTIPELFARRLEADPDGEYLDMGGVKLTARAGHGDRRLASAAHSTQLGTHQHDRVATLLENFTGGAVGLGGHGAARDGSRFR